MANLSSIAPNAPCQPSQEREGVDITLASGKDVRISEVWHMGGWTLQYVRLAANQTLNLDRDQGQVYIKVITGTLANIQREPFAGPRQIRNTRVTEDHVTAGNEDSIFAVFTETDQVGANVSSMDELVIGGPHQEAFQWLTFEDKFGAFAEVFNGLDAYMSGGFHLLDDDGTEVTYVNLWTAGKGANLTTHNHANPPNPLAPAFAEVHWVFNNGTGRGGMYGADAPDAPHSNDYPMQRGDEHGSFFHVDPETGKPQHLDNGAVAYPWHGWEAGRDDEPGQAYDVVAAFETNPDYVRISQ
ncbi:MAG: hypothetical protein CMQ49_01445 [Gammaproteobacteria bacterium]|nr:hypothetical protein [Gammaproteobacteria bacterium]